ncbi:MULTISPECIES: hypothetical protein [unclassified Pseudoalteromonas]|uniref:tetratricopeptide repeat protein n=1 Tax=unclassified Pseudoalteromonas TaxID=194690 RepID=UPI00110C0FE4|nr:MULTISPECIES: hypothetical protein [unclassified Pseudoalteromonas]TMP46481.1 hypothetical protein CWB80_09985 [Pseudoalteromonas sp. S1650]TMP66015.1 hypothetical protein CWB79_13650 [Pseudoalteromonas sp. S1649]
MADFTLDKSHAERALLKQVAEKVDKGENQKAIILLQEALELHTHSELILNSLINLYKQLGQLDVARKYTQTLLNLQSTQVDLPTDSDFDYLDAQLLELSEEEYSFDEPLVETPAPRKTLSLKTKPKPQPKDHDEKSKIVVKNKFKHALDNNKPKSERAFQDTFKPDVACQTQVAAHSEQAGVYSTKGSISTPVSSEPSEPTKLELQNDADTITSVTSKQDNKQHSQADEGSSNSTEQSDTQLKSLPLAKEELDGTEENDIATSDFDWFDNDFESVSEQQIEEDYFDDFEVSSFEENESANELSFYDLWDDALDECDEAEEERGVLADTLKPEARAKLVAVEFVDSVNWDKSTLAFFTEVFTSRGWSNIKTALEREVNAGATFEELQLAFEIKTLWLQSSRYWITFSRAYGPGESTDATCRHCSWSQALRLLRVFESIPELEEVYDFLEHEFELWFSHGVLRKCFPAFAKYLFNYRLHERNIPEFNHGFYGTGEYEQADLNWLQLPHSDEMSHLRELGLDLLSLHAPKIDYISDKYTLEYLFEYWRSTTPESERGKYFEK